MKRKVWEVLALFIVLAVAVKLLEEYVLPLLPAILPAVAIILIISMLVGKHRRRW